MLRCRVKAAAVANLTDARYFAALGVDYLGFALEPGAVGYVDQLVVAALREWIEGPELVGEFGALATAEIVRLSEQLDLHVVQVGSVALSEVPGMSRAGEVGRATGLPVLQELVMGGGMTPANAQSVLDANAADVRGFILDFARNGLSWDTLQADPDWMEWLVETCADYQVLLDIPAPASSLDEVLEALSPVGIQLRGGEEEAVGVKSFEDLDDWFEELRV